MELPEIEEIRRLDLRPDDIIVVRYAKAMSYEVRDHIAAQLKAVFGGDGRKILVLDQGMTLDVLTSAEVAACTR